MTRPAAIPRGPLEVEARHRKLIPTFDPLPAGKGHRGENSRSLVELGIVERLPQRGRGELLAAAKLAATSRPNATEPFPEANVAYFARRLASPREVASPESAGSPASHRCICRPLRRRHNRSRRFEKPAGHLAAAFDVLSPQNRRSLRRARSSSSGAWRTNEGPRVAARHPKS